MKHTTCIECDDDIRIGFGEPRLCPICLVDHIAIHDRNARVAAARTEKAGTAA